VALIQEDTALTEAPVFEMEDTECGVWLNILPTCCRGWIVLTLLVCNIIDLSGYLGVWFLNHQITRGTEPLKVC